MSWLRRNLGVESRGGSPSWRWVGVAAVVLLAGLVGGLVVLVGGGSAAVSRSTITKDVDANGDGVFSNSETVPTTATYPWTVTYRLTLTGGTPAGSQVDSLTDSTTSNLGGCQALVRTTIPANGCVSCTST